MILFVIAVLLGLVAIGLIVKGSISWTDTDTGEDESFPLRIIGFGLAVVAGLLMLWSASYSQSVGEAVIVKSPSGSVVDVDTSAGWGLTAPWNKTSTWDLTNKRLEFTGNGDDADGPALAVALDGSANGAINQVVTYSIPRDDDTLERLDREYRNQERFEDLALIPSLKSVTQDEAVRFGPYVIKEERGTLDVDLTQALTERWGEEGAELQGIEITGISLDEATETKLREVTARQADVAEAEAALEASRIAGETLREEAKAQADADQIARCGATTRQVTREVSGREIETTEVIPIADDQCQNRLNEQVLLNKWIEAMAELAGKEGNVIVVPQDMSSILNVGG